MTKEGKNRLTLTLLLIGVVVGIAYRVIETPWVFNLVTIITVPLVALFFTFRVHLDSINDENFKKEMIEYGPVKLKKYLKIRKKMLIVTKWSNTILGDKEELRKIKEKIDFVNMKMNQI